MPSLADSDEAALGMISSAASGADAAPTDPRLGVQHDFGGEASGSGMDWFTQR